VAVIDGKYEVLSQRVLAEGQLLLNATAPDGTSLNIVWFDFVTPQQEAQFETYRRTLRALKREGLAALHDVVARPGATYVAWYTPGSSKQVSAPPELKEQLREHGYSAEQADIRKDKSGVRVYGLAFNEARILAQTPPPVSKAQPKRTSLLERLARWPLWVFRWGLFTLFSLLGVALLYLSFGLSVTNRLVRLPDLSGQNVNSAAQQLYDAHLNVSVEAVASRETSFTVTTLSPEIGTPLRPGQRVRLSYALPADQVALTEVPELRGTELSDEVQTILERAKLKLGSISYIHSNIKSNFIIAQSRGAGGQANEGSTVDLLVSEGLASEQTFVPDLSGLPFEEARALGQLAGIRVLPPERRDDSRYPAGTVIAQSLPPMTPVELRDAVLRLTVSGNTSPLPQIGVPSFIGMNRENAERTARAAGFNISFESVDNPNESLNLPEGVVSQTPAPNAEGADKTVTLLYNLHPVAVPRPKVVARVLEPKERRASYLFLVESGIPDITARVTATTLDGRLFNVGQPQRVKGGDLVNGSWQTRAPGPITFRLYLGADSRPYREITVNP